MPETSATIALTFTIIGVFASPSFCKISIEVISEISGKLMSCLEFSTSTFVARPFSVIASGVKARSSSWLLLTILNALVLYSPAGAKIDRSFWICQLIPLFVFTPEYIQNWVPDGFSSNNCTSCAKVSESIWKLAIIFGAVDEVPGEELRLKSIKSSSIFWTSTLVLAVSLSRLISLDSCTSLPAVEEQLFDAFTVRLYLLLPLASSGTS